MVLGGLDLGRALVDAVQNSLATLGIARSLPHGFDPPGGAGVDPGTDNLGRKLTAWSRSFSVRFPKFKKTSEIC